MRRLLAALAVLATCAPARAATQPALQFEGRLTAGPSYDTNVRRRSSGTGVLADEGLFLLGAADLLWRPADGHATTLSWDAGGRVFDEVGAEDQLVQLLAAGHAMRIGQSWVASAELRRKDQALRSGERDSADTSGYVALELQATDWLAPRVRAGFRRFDWWPDDTWSGSGPWGGVSVQLRPARRHTATAGWDVHLRDYPGRRETAHYGQLGWTWRSRVLLSGGYLLGLTDSDVGGYETVRHRLQLLVGAPLPAGFVVNGQAVLQLVSFPEGFRLDQFTTADDEESLSSLSLKVARPIGGGVSLEARYQFHLATFVRAGLEYERHVVGTAVTWRF